MSWVYFVHAPVADLIKIGITRTSLEGRLEGLRSMSPVPLVPLGYVHGMGWEERDFHRRFAGLRHHGEWFREDPAIFDFIREFAIPWPAPGVEVARYVDWPDRMPWDRVGLSPEVQEALDRRIDKFAGEMIEIDGREQTAGEWSAQTGASVKDLFFSRATW